MREFPTFTDAQVSALEGLYPARTIRKTESFEDHLRYAGMVDLIAMMRGHVIGTSKDLMLTEDEEEAIDEEAVALAIQQQQQGET